jgi:eukaryotic-like serine/threonine-protein kinase
MKIAAGSHLNHYEIVALLGVGGMGEVYKASDTRLGRPVALKILPAHLVADADRVRRFIQEAKSASALNHPHIVTIYEIGEAEVEDREVKDREGQDREGQGQGEERGGRVHYIAMEFVDGSTLHQKIHRDRADLRKLLEYFAQAGDGLAKAHAAGIVHRDLKPENIMITEDGYAKILDFGLAKLIEPGGPSGDGLEEAATAMMGQTRPGMVMGTIGYMSPEQAQGKAIDQRSDIFSFGCILYEASTGRKPFTGDSVIDSLHKIVYMQAPLIRETNPNAPAELQRIVRKCLAKDPADRYQSIRDVAVDLRDLLREYDSQQTISASFAPPSGSYTQAPSTDSHSQFAPTLMRPQSTTTGPQEALSSGAISGAASAPEAGFAPPRKSKSLMPIGAGLLVLAIAAAAYFFIAQKQREGKPAVPFQTTRINKLTSTGKASGAVISPDGKYVAHFLAEAGQPGVWVRQVATSSNVQIVPPAEFSYVGLTFSRDGNYVYYVRAPKGENIRTLYQVPVLGGAARQIVEDVDSAITFSPDGKRFAFVRGYTQEGETALIVANADGTEEQKLAVKKQPDILVQPVWSPDGKIIACSARSTAGGIHMEIVEIQVANGAERTITPQKWLFIGGLNWLSDGSGLIISALEETPASGHTQIWKVSYPAGEARRITNDLNDYTGVSISADSTAMVTVQVTANSNLWVAPNGDATRAKQITSGSNSYDNSLSWTPDGKIVYVTGANGPPDVWIMDSDGKNQRQLTSGAGVNIFSSVSPDGRFILFDSSRHSSTLNTFNVWRMNIDGTNPKQLTFGGSEYFPVSSADGKWVIYNTLLDNGKPSLWRAPIDGGDPVRLTDYVSARPAISPDGKFIACQYHDNQPTSPVKIAIVSIDGGQPIKVLNKQSSLFEWSSDGKAVIYLDTKGGVSNLWSMPVDGGATRQLTNFNSDLIFTFDWSPDGKQLACARGVQTTDVILIKDLGQEGKE